MKSIIIFFWIMLTASISVAAQQSLNDSYDITKIRFTPTSTALLASTTTSTHTINTDELSPPIQKSANDDRDCTNLAYQVTLFKPCDTEDGKQLWARTKLLMLLGVGVAGFIALLPEDISKWDKSEYQSGDLFKQWYENVKAGPVWDNDKWYINYIGHPYFGGVYYQNARKAGYNQWNSFVYTTLMSTFYWEYGLEAFAETPSLQDLFVTPIGGWIYGEWAYNKEKALIANGGYALGSKFWGSVARFFIDPVGVVGGWFGMKHIKVTSFNITRQPTDRAASKVKSDSDYWGIKLALKF